MSTVPASRPRTKTTRLAPSVATPLNGRRTDPPHRSLPLERASVATQMLSGDAQSRAARLLWDLPHMCDAKACRKLIDLAAGGTVSAARQTAVSAARQTAVAERVRAWLESDPLLARSAWEGVVWLSHLPRVASLVEESLWRQFIEQVESLAAEAEVGPACDDPLRFSLLAIEFPLLLAGWSSDAARRARWRESAVASLLRLSEEWLDGEGMPQARDVASVASVLASWTRALQMMKGADEGVPREVCEQHACLLRQTLRLLRFDGRLPFEAVGAGSSGSCLAAAVELADDAEATTLYRTLHDPCKTTSNRRTAIEPTAYSEWGSLATLRCEPKRNSPQVIVGFDGARPRLEIVGQAGVDAALLFSGEWTAELTVSGRPIAVESTWEEVCWHLDGDAAYLELEAKLAEGWLLQRHILLAKEEGFLLLADAVLGPEAMADTTAPLHYAASLPLAAGTTFEPEAETHEGFLAQRSRRWLAMPLALPEWRSDRPLGALKVESNRLLLTSQRAGRNLFVPLFISLSGSRGKPEYTWRRLTVAEQLEPQSPDVAVAFRAQVGDRQWAFYRSLGERGNRTFLGKNLVTEFFAGVLHRTGQLDPIMEVE
jgi:hypothetical protein